jgi:parallel beta-helix repeat protein
MKWRSKMKSMGPVLPFTVGLMVGLFVLGISNAQSKQGFTSHRGPHWKAKPVTCGITLQHGYYELTGDLTCSEDPAITITGPAKLDLKGYTLSGDDGANDCIRIRDDGGAKVWNGTVMNCKDGIRIESSHNNIISVKSYNNDRRGFRIDGGNQNLLENCSATNNGQQGFKIEGGATHNRVTRCSATDNGRHGIQIDEGDRNEISGSTVRGSCRDGIEVFGNKNLVFNNHVEDNGNPQTCDDFGADYNPWAYAGIDVVDVVSVSENNKIKYNNACGNQGCNGSENEPCDARERNFWDEYVDINGNHVITNQWKNNTVCPEYVPSPEQD